MSEPEFEFATCHDCGTYIMKEEPVFFTTDRQEGWGQVGDVICGRCWRMRHERE